MEYFTIQDLSPPDFSVTDALSRTTDYTYNATGFLEKIIDPTGDYLKYAYNTTGRPVEESIYTASGTRTFYRGTDYGTAATNPAISSGKPYKTLSYNQAGTALVATTYAYDTSGNLTGVTDANSNTTGYHYDLFGRMVQVTQPGSAITAYAYDIHGNLAEVTDGRHGGRIQIINYSDLKPPLPVSASFISFVPYHRSHNRL